METKICVGMDCKAAGEGTSRVVFATTGVIDKDGDYTVAGAFGRQEARIQPAHDWNEHNLGKADVFEKGDEAQALLKWNLNTQLGRDWFSSIKFNLQYGVEQNWSYGYDVIEQDASLARRVGAKRALVRVKVHEVSPVLLGAGINTRTLEVKRCLTCGSEQPRIEQPKAHSCSCGAKANGAGDLSAVFMADLLAEVKALRSEVAALKAPRVSHGRDFGPEFVARCMARLEGGRNGRSSY